MGNRTLVAFAGLSAAILGGGCGHGSGSAGPTSVPASALAASGGPPVSAGEFCQRIHDLNTTAQAVGLDKAVLAVRSDLASAAAVAAQESAGGVPQGSGLQPVLARLAGDLRVMAAWADTSATQAELDHSREPTAVKASLADMGNQFRRLQDWADVNCKYSQQGDGH